KSTGIEAFPVDIPYHKPFVINGGPSYVGDHVITRVRTDEGIVGYGEGAPMVSYSDETQKDLLNGVLDYLAPAVAGLDPFDLEAIHHTMEAVLPGHHFAKASIDLALYDIMGKKLGVPVYKLLGGKVRDRIPIAWVVGIGPIDEMLADAVHHIGTYGFGTLKLKIGREPKKDLEMVRAIREAIGPNVKIRVDANQGYDVATAIRTLRQMERYDLELVEQPVPKWNILGMAEVAAALDVPIEADESMFGYHDAMTLIRLRAADIINIKIMKPCGLYGSKKVAAVAEAAGVTCLVGSMVEFGPGTAAGLHFAAANSVVAHACEMVGGMFFKGDVVEEDFSLKAVVDGCLPVPEKPGLGITLKEAYR
ncbi:MAG TPA: enolase C-terminal domain-like protein, partial [Symbiobacteriaceae bacterium]|nr:enolase C-terminal domain-like protein [Symbiobacteriaceae bacterium]